MASTKKTLKKYAVISAGTMTGTTTLTSSVTTITGMDNVGFQFDFTGTPVGTFVIEVSASHNEDELGNVLTLGTFIPLLVTYYDTGTSAFVSTYAISTSVGSPIYVDCTQMSAPYIRCRYVNASSTGVLTATICGKSL